MLHIAIVEDDAASLRRIESYLKKYLMETKNRAAFESFSNGLDFLERQLEVDFNIIFLDIMLPMMDGFEIAGKIRKRSELASIIFLTNMAQYAVKGYEYLTIGDDAHNALNNILAAKGYSQENDMIEGGDPSKVYSWTQESLDTESYRYAEVTDEEVTNQFDFADPSYYGIDFTYLSRSDWENTYPVEAAAITATDEMIEDIDSTWYEKSEDAPDVSDFTQGADNGLQFVDMKNVEWEDEETWNAFLDQLTVDEMAGMMNDARGAESVDSIGMPAFKRTDDNMMVDSAMTASESTGLGWVSEVMTSKTWNKERAEQRGHLIGNECAFAGVNEIWYGGGNIHRTPFSGRNRQYYSEDGNFGYIMGAIEAEAMQTSGTIYCAKHFALNDQENGREGISTFASEQAIRENYLRAFEGAVTKGGALGIMASFNRIGCIQTYVNSALLQDVLRNEWGFKGHVTTDGFSLTPYKTHYLEMFVSGIDYSCLDAGNTSAAVKTAIADGDGYILQRLREATKANVYVASRTTAVNGLSGNTRVVSIVPAWEIALIQEKLK